MDESVLPEANPGSTPDFSEKSVVVTLRCLLHHGPARLELVALGGLVFPMKSVSGVLRSNSDYFLLKTQAMDFPKSGRRDSNPRPLEPHSSALPS